MHRAVMPAGIVLAARLVSYRAQTAVFQSTATPSVVGEDEAHSSTRP